MYQVCLQAQAVEKRPNRYVFVPAVAYSPETGLMFGGLGALYLDLAKGDTTARMSGIAALGTYTTKEQLLLGLRWNLFTASEKYIIEGEAAYRDDVDRHYGIGNDALEEVYQSTPSTGAINGVENFLDFKVKRLSFSASLYRKIHAKWYVGITGEWEYLKKFEPFANQQHLHSEEITRVPVNALIAGLGVGSIWDTRQTTDNPLSGLYIQLKSLVYNGAFSSEYDYISATLDLRHYWNTWEKHTFASRFILDQRFHTHDAIPLYSMPTIGGKEFVRGYYEGTYRDNHLFGLEVEYRLPLWQDSESSIWQFWKRLGITAFASAARVFPDWKNVALNDLRVTLGGGIRYVLDFEQRLNLRLDVGYGFDKNAAIEGRQWGFYFFISEAF